MCGICVSISAHAEDGDEDRNPISDNLRRRLSNRGPDYSGDLLSRCESTDAQGCSRRVNLRFLSTVLSLRGDGITRQPFCDSASGALFSWNGEAWKLRGSEIDGNDGAAVFQLLTAASRNAPTSDRQARQAAVVEALRSLEGPFAFVFFDKEAGQVYFGRDRLGRRSLLLRSGGTKDGPQTLLSLSSVSDPQESGWREVEADGIYTLDVQRLADTLPGKVDDCIHRHAWERDCAVGSSESLVLGIGPFNMATEPPEDKAALSIGSPAVQELRDRLTDSLRLRVLHVPKPPAAKTDEPDTRIAILFSGGLDCTLLARISSDLLPPEQAIDLINVAFENPRVVSHLGPEVTDFYEACPDRITGRKSFAELQTVCPNRRWRFIAVNVPYAETRAQRAEIVSLMYPHNTEMDLSIASALYFAARGSGLCTEKKEASPVSYCTPARVLLSGLGADELFGGYGRHGIAFSRQGYAGLAKELHLDISRLGKRNLGRDDRVLANWSKEVRFPFLDEEFVQWAMALPAWEKCDFANPLQDDSQGPAGPAGGSVEPAKRLLRLAALSLGMGGVAREKKRAIQFGARTAKMESGQVKGTAVVS